MKFIDRIKEVVEPPMNNTTNSTKEKEKATDYNDYFNRCMDDLNKYIYFFCDRRQWFKGLTYQYIYDKDNFQKYFIDRVYNKQTALTEMAVKNITSLRDFPFEQEFRLVSCTHAYAPRGAYKLSYCKYLMKTLLGEYNPEKLYELCKERAENLRKVIKEIEPSTYFEGDNFFYDPTPDKEYNPDELFVYDLSRNFNRYLYNWETYATPQFRFEIDNNEYNTDKLQPFITKRYFLHAIKIFDNVGKIGNECEDPEDLITPGKAYLNKHAAIVDKNGNLLEEDILGAYPRFDFHGMIETKYYI